MFYVLVQLSFVVTYILRVNDFMDISQYLLVLGMVNISVNRNGGLEHH